MQPFHKIFVVIQSHECRLPLWRLLHFNPWILGLILYVIHHIFMKSNFINIYFSNSLIKWLGPTLWITEPIKLISNKYFISLLRDYEFHLENIYSINIATAQHTEVLTVTYRSHSWYIKATYISWSDPLFSQDLELM